MYLRKGKFHLSLHAGVLGERGLAPLDLNTPA